MMHMENRLVQAQSQRLMLTQKMQQALKILQYNALELDTHIQNEIEANPLLDQLAPENELSPEQSPELAQGHDGADFDDIGGFDLDMFNDPWERRLHEGKDLSINPDLGARRDYYENSITKEETLLSRLMDQLRLAFENKLEYGIGELIAGDIDSRGFYTGALEEIASVMQVPLEQVERVLYRIQRFEPIGVGARDVVECLLLQIMVEYPDEMQLKELVEFHLEDLQHRQIPKIAKAMKVTPERVEELKQILATLNPYPGEEYAGDAAQYVIPELVVEKKDGEWSVALTSEGSPSLKLNDDYQGLSKDRSIDKDERSYLREKMESAKWLIRNIEQRQQTILKIGKAIMDIQQDFLEKGVDQIKPLTLQNIADVVGVHEATVSRTTRGKYVQTPQGLFELKYFFSTGLKTDSGEDQSSKSVQLRIKKIVEEENKRKPLSDQKIANALKEEGINIARRTITKYREALNIPSTTMRREY
jgi:RNA polymerase sigma-54 factor